jgi:hypothetical protein
MALAWRERMKPRDTLIRYPAFGPSIEPGIPWTTIMIKAERKYSVQQFPNNPPSSAIVSACEMKCNSGTLLVLGLVLATSRLLCFFIPCLLCGEFLRLFGKVMSCGVWNLRQCDGVCVAHGGVCLLLTELSDFVLPFSFLMFPSNASTPISFAMLLPSECLSA